ncbi:glycosyltransferase family 2 protein [Winogradskyella jejuensis]|uniref:Glycosyltransferase involved in cell wall bisynthesis n=1 Tax=Winogradskyella jejuensis TaxID=1089305 RepID=A0A1M5JUE8_9FLAO|nr:glycosyltransferase family 2 protein [Winogradskyella jejuensis]SHG44181.1 Glycosyltransferase involved in cell wall bisynthesis [Winogradskyella jejuensis]
MPNISVIISTYNQPEWLEKVLYGYEIQSYTDFEIIIADDGSTQETKTLIERFSETSKYNISHVWQEDKGFRKTKILNKAIVASQGEYLILTDGDCIPRKDFVQCHFELRKSGCFLSGGYFKLPQSISKKITKEDIENQNCFDKRWLLDQGLKKSFKLNKLTSKGLKERLLNTLTPTKATWDGMNASGWKQDILKVNGFDERMAYGGEDRELGERLMNLGAKPIQIRYSAICVHLYHTRGYKNEAAEQANLKIRKETKSKKKTWTDFGIKKDKA